MGTPGVVPSFSKDEIVEVALALIDEKGTKGFTIRALADRVGISPMGIYTYFSSKEDIAAHVLGRVLSEVDNEPVPGEFWEDTLHRVCDSIRAAALAHPKARLMRHELGVGWPQVHNRHVYCLHLDQGMPRGVYEHMHHVLRAFLDGYLDQEARATVQRTDSDIPDEEEWTRVSIGSYESEAFNQGIDFIIAGTRAIAAPSDCEWYTPEDPAKWTLI
ncbi:Tetracycline repressor protein class E [Slackia heliotrinireducens]|nr:Tetracycline repressor protein class E [Slackia heliotrinireducens]